jgi:methionyl-tRNA formyltransferase
VDEGLDTGDVYLRTDLSLEGKADEIFVRAGEVIKNMIDEIINNEITPVKQSGTPTYFVRRKPEESKIDNQINDVKSMYNFIRMLDAKNYPKAFLENDIFKFEFTNAKIENEFEITAHVRIIKK